MKKVLFGFLLMSLMFGLTFTTACGDDDDGADADTDSDSDTDSSTDADTDTDTDGDTDTDPCAGWDDCEDFESYASGDSITDMNDQWITWSDPPLPDEPAYVSDKMALDSLLSLRILDNNDVVWLLEFESGHWLIEFDMFIMAGKTGYYNFQQVFATVWAFEMYFYDGGVGICRIAGKDYKFTFKSGDWLKATLDVDIDNDEATILIDDVEVFTWPWSTAQGEPPGACYGIDFYGAPDPPGNDYFMDNVRYKAL